MPSFFLVVVAYFLLVTFLSGPIGETTLDPLFAYYWVQIKFIFGYLPIYVWGFLITTFVYFVVTRLRKGSFLKRYFLLLKRFFVLVLTASLVSFFFLYLIAFLELNVLAILTYISPRLLGVEANPQTISEKIKGYEKSPVVIAGGKENNRIVYTIATAESGKSSFYGDRIVAYLPDFLTIPAKNPDSGVLLVGDSLIINDLNSADFQRVSPILSNIMISKYFTGRALKAYPKVELMDKNEYLVYRSSDFKDKLKKFDEVIAKVNDDSLVLNDSIADLTGKITENKSSIENKSKEREKAYIKCVNIGSYKAGVFIKTNSQEYCQNQVSELENEISQLKSEGDEFTKELNDDQNRLTQYQTLSRYYSSEKIITQEASNFISYEFGTFNSPDVIKISLVMENNTQTTADLLELVVHEYLHYTRYEENGMRLSSSFFDEGLTEYFARKIIKNSLGVTTNLGYPINVKIIDQIMKRIAERDMADIYFANDQIGLEKLLDRVYGKDFYKNNVILFETLQYASNKEQLLSIGDKIMGEIGGSSLEEKDLSTTYSTFK